MSFKSVYSFIAPYGVDYELLILRLQNELIHKFDKATIIYELQLDYDNLTLKHNKYSNQEEIYIHTDKISNIEDFLKVKYILLNLGFIEGMSL